MKKLYVVRWEIEAVVAAESDDDACDVAEDFWHEVSSDSLGSPDLVQPMGYMPSGWENDSLPYGGDDDQTVGQYIEAGAAPVYSERARKFAERKYAEVRAKQLAAKAVEDDGK